MVFLDSLEHILNIIYDISKLACIDFDDDATVSQARFWHFEYYVWYDDFSK
jgi:hypothetical protein